MQYQLPELTLRKWEQSDLDDLVKYANNKNISDNLTNEFPYPYTNLDGKQFIDSVSTDDPVKVFAIVINNEACGSIGIFPQTDVYKKIAEIGYWLAEKHWNRGFITISIRKIIEYGFNTWDIFRIYAKPFGSNVSSHRALEKSGMKLEAQLKNSIYKCGRLQDEFIYAIVLSNK